MNIQKMMKQAQEMQKKISTMQAELEQKEVEGSSGGGMVKVTLTGKGTASKVALDASLLKTEEKDMLEDLIVAAINDARAKVDAMFNESMGSVASGLNLPPGFNFS